MASTPRVTSEHYAFEPIEVGIAFGRARSSGTALSNTGLVDLGGSTLVFDTSLTLRSARAIREASSVLTGRPPTLLANSHWHLDHVLGNQLFADRPIYATKRTVEILLEKRAELERELEPSRLEADIRELEDRRAKATTDDGRAVYDAVLRINRALHEEALELKLTPPTKEFDGELRLPGAPDARLLTFGAGHTESDAVLFLAESRILFAGDLVVSGTHPNLTSGDPEHWLTVLDAIEGLRPERIVPGHGPIGSTETLTQMRDYLSTVLELAREPGTPEVPARFRKWAMSDQFHGNLAFARSRSKPET